MMEKNVNYSVVPHRNPGKLQAPAKFYAQAQASGVMDILEISERLQRECTLTRADIIAVLIALEDVIAEAVISGQIVRLGSLCSLQISLRGQGSPDSASFIPALIKKKKIIFRPGTLLKNMQKNLTFKRVPTLIKKSDNTPTRVSSNTSM